MHVINSTARSICKTRDFQHRPRHTIIGDPRDIIFKKFKSADAYLINGIDENEAQNIRQNPSIFLKAGLLDALQRLNGKESPSTISGSSLIIYYLFVSQNILAHLVRAGQLTRDTIFT